MPGGFSNQPKILRGAFVEYGLNLPPLIVVFQFNPVQLARNHRLGFDVPAGVNQSGDGVEKSTSPASSLRDIHQKQRDLLKIREEQQVTVEEETISFEIRLDATDKLNEGDPVAGLFGIAPQLATLEAMVYPKSESILGGLLPDLSIGGFSFTKSDKPPMILFIWGRIRMLPVNIDSMNITETEFNTFLEPIRATVSVSLTVIEGRNTFYMYSKFWKEVMSMLNLANIADVANVIIPG